MAREQTPHSFNQLEPKALTDLRCNCLSAVHGGCNGYVRASHKAEQMRGWGDAVKTFGCVWLNLLRSQLFYLCVDGAFNPFFYHAWGISRQYAGEQT